METPGNQSESEAVDQLFEEPTPGSEAQETSTEEQATTGAGQQAEGAESTQQQQETKAEQFFAEVAGRKYPTKEDFIKSHETLLEKSRRMEQESKAWKAAHDRWNPWEKWLRENPDFERQLRSAEQKYRGARSQGATDAQARAVAGTNNLPPEILKKIEAHDEFVREQQQSRADSEFKTEIDTLRGKYKLDDAAVKQVMKVIYDCISTTGLDLPAEEAYLRLQAFAGRDTLAKKDAELQRVKSGDGPVTTMGARAPKKRPDQMSQKEFDAELVDQVNRMNLPD